MLSNFLNFRVPSTYESNFYQFQQNENLKNIKLLAFVIVFASALTRVIALIFAIDYDSSPFYKEISLANWISIFGYTLFWILTSFRWQSQGVKKWLYRSFSLFAILASLNFSRVVSAHNTKNTLLVLLMGILLVSIFILLSIRELMFLTILLFVAFMFSIAFEKLSIAEKIINIAADIILSICFFIFSRYNYYLKARHFIEVQILRVKNEEIENLVRQNTDILAYVAHDLRSPLANIEMLNNILLEEHPKLDEPKLIGRATQSAKAIIGDLLEALQRNKTELKLERVNLNGFMSKLLEQSKNQTERNLNCTIPNETLTIVINPEKFQRVLDNLIQNAHKFSKSEKPIDVLITRLDNKVRIAVRDYGIGIPQKDLDKVFDQFSPASRVGLKGERSFGIGLHIAKKMIELQKGTLQVESVENAGSTFTIEIACEVEPAVELIKT